MSLEENKTMIRRFFTEVFSQGNLTGADEYIAPDAILHPFPPQFPAGSQGLRMVLTAMRTTFPDAQITLEDLLAEGDKVFVRAFFRGTQTGPLMNIPSVPPTGKPCSQTQMHLFRLANGKIVEYWFNADDLGMLRQLGYMPVLQSS